MVSLVVWDSLARVLKNGVEAGQIEGSSAETHFRYSPSYLSSDLSAIATTLPKREAPFATPGRAVLPFFAGLLPEGRRLSSLQRELKTSADNDLAFLLAVGADPIGDVQVIAESGQALKREAVTIDFKDPKLDFTQLLTASGFVDRRGVPGVQDKASAQMISMPVKQLGTGEGEFILKLNPPEFKHLVENEAFFLELARGLKVPVARSILLRDSNGVPALAVRRFDRVGSVRLAAEDATQVLNVYPADKYDVSSERVATALAELCSAPPVALANILTQLVFAWLTGNGDVHGKNLSVLGGAVEGSTGSKWRMAPMYDLPSTLFYGDDEMALSFQGRKTGLTWRAVQTFAGDVGLPELAARRIVDRCLAATADLGERLGAGALPFDSRVIGKVVRVLERRRADLAS